MFTLEELEKGVFISSNKVKIEFVGSSKILSFSKPVQSYVSNVSELFYTDLPTMWELKEEDDILLSNEQFLILVNLIIKDLMKDYDLISF